MKQLLAILLCLLLFACNKKDDFTYRYTLYQNSAGSNFGYTDAGGGWHYQPAPKTFDTTFVSDTLVAKGKLNIGILVLVLSPEGDSNEVAIYLDGARIADQRGRGSVSASNP